MASCSLRVTPNAVRAFRSIFRSPVVIRRTTRRKSAGDAARLVAVWGAKRDRDLQAGAHALAGYDSERSPDAFRTFVHADQAETFSCRGGTDVESVAVIDDLQRDRIVVTLQLNSDVAGAAVLDRILHRFLRNPEQAERDIVGQGRSDVLGRHGDHHAG